MKNKVKMAAAAVLSLFVMTSMVRAETAKKEWKEKHPRRTEVNKRLKHQNKRINQGVKNGKLTKDQAKQLRKDDRQIRQEERDMASQNGGHITKEEQKTLNQQENKVSKEIYQEKHDGQAPAPAAAPASK